MKIIVGYTGFVGNNICSSTDFDGFYNSKNIDKAYGTNPDLLVYSGVKAEKYTANLFPEKDKELIEDAKRNIELINPKQIVLISTIDVLDDVNGKDEDAVINEEALEAYGYNRYQLEKWVIANYKNHLIIRLPALFGENIKKNFIFDLINIVPSKIKKEKMEELSLIENRIKSYYQLNEDGFYYIKQLLNNDKNNLIQLLEKVNFCALSFTDDRSKYQYYNLKKLWKDICVALDNNITLLHLSTEPILSSELYSMVTGKEFVNKCSRIPVNYNYKSKYYKYYGGSDGYLYDKNTILKECVDFIKSKKNRIKYKLAFSSIAFKEIDTCCSFLLKNNIEGIEVAPSMIMDNPYDDIEELVERTKEIKIKNELDVCSLQSIWYGRKENIFSSDKNRKLLIDLTKKIIDYASKVNCRNIVFGCPKNRIISCRNDEEKALTFFKELGDYAYSKNTCLSLEANPTIYGTNFINDTSSAINLIKKVNSNGFKLNLDIGTMIENNEDIAILKGNINLVNHVHISEPYLNVIKERNLHITIKELLINENYNRYISVEMKNTDNINDLEKTIKYIKKVFEK